MTYEGLKDPQSTLIRGLPALIVSELFERVYRETLVTGCLT